MRIVLGVIGVLAACVFLGQSAFTLGQTAYGMASDQDAWRPWLMGAGAFSVVIYEGIGLALAGFLWHFKRYGLAFGCCLLVLAAAVYTVRLELAYNVTGQADRIAEREASTERRTEAKADLARLRAEREKIGVLRPPEAIRAELESYREHKRWHSTSGCTNATVPESIAYCAQYHKMQAQLASSIRLGEINKEIERIDGERHWTPVNAGGAPDAAWASRTFGGDEQGWQDALMVFGILFWVLARTLALPIAVGAMSGGRAASMPTPAEDDVSDDAQMDDVSPGTNVIVLDQNRDVSSPDTSAVYDDHLREFLSTRSPGEYVFADFFAGYEGWCERKEREPLGRSFFSHRLNALGCETGRPNGARKTMIAVPEHLARGSGGAQTEIAEAA